MKALLEDVFLEPLFEEICPRKSHEDALVEHAWKRLTTLFWSTIVVAGLNGLFFQETKVQKKKCLRTKTKQKYKTCIFLSTQKMILSKQFSFRARVLCDVAQHSNSWKKIALEPTFACIFMAGITQTTFYYEPDTCGKNVWWNPWMIGDTFGPISTTMIDLIRFEMIFSLHVMFEVADHALLQTSLQQIFPPFPTTHFPGLSSGCTWSCSEMRVNQTTWKLSTPIYLVHRCQAQGGATVL